MSEHNELGKEGEAIALQYLKDKGYSILAINWRFGKEEIDIIARDKDAIVFVEVKTRTNAYFETPEQAVNLKKQRFLINAANRFIQSNNIENESRFDIVSVIHNSKYQNINHIESAFYPTL